MIQAGIARKAMGLKIAAKRNIMPTHIKNLESSSAPYLPIIQRLNPEPKLPKNRLIPTKTSVFCTFAQRICTNVIIAEFFKKNYDVFLKSGAKQ